MWIFRAWASALRLQEDETSFSSYLDCQVGTLDAPSAWKWASSVQPGWSGSPLAAAPPSAFHRSLHEGSTCAPDAGRPRFSEGSGGQIQDELHDQQMGPDVPGPLADQQPDEAVSLVRRYESLTISQ